MKSEKKPGFITKVLIIALTLVIVSYFTNILYGPREKIKEISYSELWGKIKNGEITEVIISGNEISGNSKPPEGKFRTFVIESSIAKIAEDLASQKVKVKMAPPTTLWSILLTNFLPFLIFIGFWIFMLRRAGGAGRAGSPLAFGKNKALLIKSGQQKKVTFADVAGIDDAKEELVEIVEFLKEPDKFQKLGGRIPKGVLLIGMPGTGKTLLARAVAGEANVPFFKIDGSEFVEMFVGVGASRVRSLFEDGKKNAPCIIFIDEIDAVGRHRGTGLGNSNDEREQTVNQLLAEMDGFESNESMVIIAATNRPDVLDPGLLRPGRFDRKVVVPMPDIKGREAILQVHCQNMPLADDVDLSIVARGTPGFSGSALANLANEAALSAGIKNQKQITASDFEKAREKEMMGKERSLIMTSQEKETIAYHEAGHTLVAALIPEIDPIHKVTIIPRGQSLGLTTIPPERDRYNYSKKYLEAWITVLLAGRSAEKIFLDIETTGAQNDLEVATEKAWDMVTKFGMSGRLGLRTFGENTEHPFLGKVMATRLGVNTSPKKAEQIDEEVDAILETARKRAEKILRENRSTLVFLAAELLKKETLNRKEVEEIVMLGTLPDQF